MKLSELEHQRILILGYGVEGKATYQFLKTNAPSATLGIADQTDGPDYLDRQVSYDLAIRSPGVLPELIKIPHTTATNLFFANVTKPIIGVTGSKGKSTTSALIKRILETSGQRACLVGNIGTPMLSSLREEVDYYVCELSSYQLEDTQYSPHISVITSIFPEHLDHHGDFERYWQAKKRIVKFATLEDFYVYNPKFPLLLDLAEETKASSQPYLSELPFGPDDVVLEGEHNWDNIRGAATVASLLGIGVEEVEAAVKTFQPLAHRLQRIGTFQGITFYDDAISTAPESTLAALRTLKNVSTLFLGGQDRGYDFRALVKEIHSLKIANLVVFPDSGAKIIDEFKRQSLSLPKVLATESMEEAVRFAYQTAPQGTICLLSCASPSYSLWKNFEEKGDQFQKLVKALPHET